ncbi:TRAP transporter large permease [Roseovarius halotolerans]|uniref:TRAP transporter large permease n=1 Tax=Roseovarius halotolerans TaxID=505353 RepID=UPI0014762A69|nr:TRAP transporter large permease subunit [Roseovarius halotolerans]
MSDSFSSPTRADAENRYEDALNRLAGITGVISAIGVLAMTGIVGYEVLSRSLFNEPTIWSAEISTYLLVAIAFLGLTAALRGGDHVQVEVLLTGLPDRWSRRLLCFGDWLGLTMVAFAAWQMAFFNYAEYVNDTRDWGLLATPQWIPELPVSIGLALFAAGLLLEIMRKSERVFSVIIVALLMAGLAIALFILGARPPSILGTRLDWGSASIAIWICLSALAINGPGMAGAVGAALIGVSGIYWLANGLGLAAVGALIAMTILVLLVIGVRVALALGIMGLLTLLFLLPTPQLSVLAERSWNSVNTFTLTAVPMFVLMGALLIRSGVTREMFDAMGKWFGRTPGGLAHASVGASAVFAAVSGSSLATAATMGKVACPEMIERGYDRRLTYGVVAAGATLGILIPPSIAMIIYGTTVGVPVTQLFMAGVIPGLLLSAGFMGCVLIWSLLRPEATPRGMHYSLAEKIRGSLSVLPFGLIIVAVLGSLYAGFATPTEAGAVGAIASLLVCAMRRMVSLRLLYETALETARITSFLLLIVVGAAIMSWGFDFLQIPRSLVSTVDNANLPPWAVVLILAALYVVLGMFVESISMMLMTLPVTFPIIIALGLDPIWFGVALVVMIELGLVTPPVGIVLFVLRGVSGDVPLRDIVYGVLPFVVVILLFQVLIYFVPELVLWLPEQTK